MSKRRDLPAPRKPVRPDLQAGVIGHLFGLPVVVDRGRDVDRAAAAFRGGPCSLADARRPAGAGDGPMSEAPEG